MGTPCSHGQSLTAHPLQATPLPFTYCLGIERAWIPESPKRTETWCLQLYQESQIWNLLALSVAVLIQLMKQEFGHRTHMFFILHNMT